MFVLKWMRCGYIAVNQGLSLLLPVADLITRVYLFCIFYFSGIQKWQSFDETLMLFEYEYQVPLLSPFYAAWMGTWVEILVPIFLLIGWFGRVPALALFAFNAVAVWSYPELWTARGIGGWNQHLHWGMLLMLLMCMGPKCFSLDSLMRYFCKRHCSSKD